MRNFLIAAAFAATAACQPAAVKAPEAAPPATEPDEPLAEVPVEVSFSLTDADGSVNLVIDEGVPDLTFSLDCAATGQSLTATGATSQVALGNMAYPYSISLSGQSFPADLVPGDETATTFAVTAPLTPDVLAALSGATTARIFVNDGYAFVESGIDSGENFEAFAAACAAKTGLTPTP